MSSTAPSRPPQDIFSSMITLLRSSVKTPTMNSLGSLARITLHRARQERGVSPFSLSSDAFSSPCSLFASSRAATRDAAFALPNPPIFRNSLKEVLASPWRLPNSFRRWEETSRTFRSLSPVLRSIARSSASERAWGPNFSSLSRGSSATGTSARLKMFPPARKDWICALRL